MTSEKFIPGRELSVRFYTEAVRPILDVHAAGIPYAAALVGPGSDVLGFDTPRSMDHDWGPRLTLFLPEAGFEADAARLDEMLLRDLPDTVAGFPTRFREFANDPGIVHMATGDGEGPLAHRARITTVSAFLRETIGVPATDDLDAASWMAIPGQVLLEVTGGAVYHDEPGDLTAARGALAWYPDDVWRYRLAAAWKRIAQVEPFVGRSGEVDDDLGSHVIAMSMVRDIMHLALLQERRYAPYSKWLGTAFSRLEVAGEIDPLLDSARFARSWSERERGIVEALAILGTRQNDLGLSVAVDPTPRPFFDRPFMVVDAERFANALDEAITDPAVKALPRHLGGIDQFVDSTDALVSRELRDAIRTWMGDG